MTRSRASYSVMRRSVLQEMGLSLAVSFMFFFFVFFVNQLLLIAQRILVKQIDMAAMVQLVALAIPQILLYTIPFSSLAAASMVVGDLSSRNELLAFRSVGISMRHVFIPILFASCLLSILTFWVADVLLPYSSARYRTLYAELLRELPTIELESNSVNRIGATTLAIGDVLDSKISDVVLVDAKPTGSRTVTAQEGNLELVDFNRFIYKLDLIQPRVLETTDGSVDEFSFAKAASMTYWMDFSSQISRYTDVSPSQLNSRDLIAEIEQRSEDVLLEKNQRNEGISDLFIQMITLQRSFMIDASNVSLQNEYRQLELKLEELEKQQPVNFYLQYYRAELHKKFALSTGCFFLVFIAFPLSFMRVRHGRLFGFALSLLIACLYWFMLFAAQTRILKVSFNAGFLVWIPNIVIFLIAATLLLARRNP